MTIHRLWIDSAPVLHHPGKQSAQIVWPENSPDAQITMTRVTMEPGAISTRHSHAISEQTWIVEAGSATLLLADNQTEGLRAGDIIRTPAGTIYGIENTGSEPFVYLTVTSPPEDMTKFYVGRKNSA
jgi:quercetin dioxygenase-like cupin family protein